MKGRHLAAMDKRNLSSSTAGLCCGSGRRERAQVAIAFCSLNAHSHAKPRLKQINLPLSFTFDIATQRQDPEAPAALRNS